LFVGIDIGGTKTHVLVEDDDRVILHERVVPTSAWKCGGLLDDEENATRLLATFADVADAASAPMVVGAHGLGRRCETGLLNSPAGGAAGPGLRIGWSPTSPLAGRRRIGDRGPFGRSGR